MEQKVTSIYEFKPGDIITRIVPSKPMTVIGDETVIDRGYIGEELLFVGIANGCVNVEKVNHKTNDILKIIMNPMLISLPLDSYSDGWSYYVDPYSILYKEYDRQGEPEKAEDKKKKKRPTSAEVNKEFEHILEESVDVLEKKLQLAIENQEFEKADLIKKQIEKLK